MEKEKKFRTEVTNKNLLAIMAKGWNGVQVSKRWGITRTHLGNLLKREGKKAQLFKDAIKGLPVKKD